MTAALICTPAIDAHVRRVSDDYEIELSAVAELYGSYEPFLLEVDEDLHWHIVNPESGRSVGRGETVEQALERAREEA